jgi:hypothetical protein
MGRLRQDDKLTFFKKPKPPDPRTLERWERRLEILSNPDGYLIQSTLFITNTKVFYVSEVRGAMKTILAGFLPSFVIKLEGAWQKSGFLFPHAHVLLPVLPEVRPFLEAVKLSGAKVYRSTYRGEDLPDPFRLLPPDRGPQNAWEYLTTIPDLTALESLVSFRDSTISTLKNTPHLARYLGKTTYTGGLRPVIEHNLAPIREAEALAPPA